MQTTPIWNLATDSERFVSPTPKHLTTAPQTGAFSPPPMAHGEDRRFCRVIQPTHSNLCLPQRRFVSLSRSCDRNLLSSQSFLWHSCCTSSNREAKPCTHFLAMKKLLVNYWSTSLNPQHHKEIKSQTQPWWKTCCEPEK